MSPPNLKFFTHPQSAALSSFLPLLKPHLPISNPIYVRIQAPRNTHSRHCQFAATFPPQTSRSPLEVPEVFTILFADRSNQNESQIWIFNPLITRSSRAELSIDEQQELKSHVEGAIYFLKNSVVTEAPGWPFSPILKFACLHERIMQAVSDIATTRDALPKSTSWDLWLIDTAKVSSKVKARRPLPEGYTIGTVPEDQLDVVLSTSSIPRQASTMSMLPNVGLLNVQGKLVAWGYVGIDGAFSTLYVLPEERGKGLASYVAVELLQTLHEGAFKAMGYAGETGWVHSHVDSKNKESAGVMRSLGGKISHIESYCWVDSARF